MLCIFLALGPVFGVDPTTYDFSLIFFVSQLELFYHCRLNVNCHLVVWRQSHKVWIQQQSLLYCVSIASVSCDLILDVGVNVDLLWVCQGHADWTDSQIVCYQLFVCWLVCPTQGLALEHWSSVTFGHNNMGYENILFLRLWIQHDRKKD